MLRVDGQGHFTAVPPAENGLVERRIPFLLARRGWFSRERDSSATFAFEWNRIGAQLEANPLRQSVFYPANDPVHPVA